MSIDDLAPKPLSREDAAALIGVLATLVGELLSGRDNGLWNRLAHRLRSEGTIPAGIGDRAGLRFGRDSDGSRVVQEANGQSPADAGGKCLEAPDDV